jgi:SnoaL-like domain
MSHAEQKLQELFDRQEIEHVLHMYCRAIDRLDVELLKSVYHPDGTDDHGSFTGNAHEFAERIMLDLKAYIIDGMHTVTHCAIDVAGNYATAESYYHAYQLCPGGMDKVAKFFGERYADKSAREGTLNGNHDYFCGGRYIDLFEKRNGQWKILRRKITNEWGLMQPTNRITDQGHVGHFNLPGSRDKNDPVYMNRIPQK